MHEINFEGMIRLNAEDILSKWGFMDGDIFNDLDLEDPHRTLYACVEDMLRKVKFKNGTPKLTYFLTCHNPARIDEEWLEEHYDIADELHGVFSLISPEYVRKIDAELAADSEPT